MAKGYIFYPFFGGSGFHTFRVNILKKTITLFISLALLSIGSSAFSQDVKAEKAIETL
jgi:hypothetical protein